MTVLISLKK